MKIRQPTSEVLVSISKMISITLFEMILLLIFLAVKVYGLKSKINSTKVSAGLRFFGPYAEKDLGP